MIYFQHYFFLTIDFESLHSTIYMNASTPIKVGLLKLDFLHICDKSN
jgi:hypothetical protein